MRELETRSAFPLVISTKTLAKPLLLSFAALGITAVPADAAAGGSRSLDDTLRVQMRATGDVAAQCRIYGYNSYSGITDHLATMHQRAGAWKRTRSTNVPKSYDWAKVTCFVSGGIFSKRTLWIDRSRTSFLRRYIRVRCGDSCSVRLALGTPDDRRPPGAE